MINLYDVLKFIDDANNILNFKNHDIYIHTRLFIS